jgi:ParB family chromosome partitioning protein
MNNSKKNVHSSGPLGMLVKTGQIKKVDSHEEAEGSLQHTGLDRLTTSTSYFRTQAGVEFKENELVSIDPKECEPWEYANRSHDEMGDIDELIKSLQDNNQLQPALVMSHPNPHDGIKYQIIFGRRRHAACLKLGIPFLVIRKDSLTIQEAISCQDAENKFRKNVSNYSNAVLYKKLLVNKEFKTEKELAEKLRISTSSLNDLMSFTRIPSDIIELIPEIHNLSVYMATKIVRLIHDDKNALPKLIQIASQLGVSITTPAKLDKALVSNVKQISTLQVNKRVVHSRTGKPLFTFKIDHKGNPAFLFPKSLANQIDFELLCEKLQSCMEDEDVESGRPDLINT